MTKASRSVREPWRTIPQRRVLVGTPSETPTVVAEQMHDRTSRPVFETTSTGVCVPETLLW
jgi:hypothetical protein